MAETALYHAIILEEGIPFDYEISVLGDRVDPATGEAVIDPETGLPFQDPVSIHGFKFLLECRENIKKKTPIISLSTENGGILITDEINGKIKINFASSITKIKKSSGIYDLVGFDSIGTPFKILYGPLSITQTVSIW